MFLDIFIPGDKNHNHLRTTFFKEIIKPPDYTLIKLLKIFYAINLLVLITENHTWTQCRDQQLDHGKSSTNRQIYFITLVVCGLGNFTEEGWGTVRSRIPARLLGNGLCRRWLSKKKKNWSNVDISRHVKMEGGNFRKSHPYTKNYRKLVTSEKRRFSLSQV